MKRLGRFFITTAMFYHHEKNMANTLAAIKFLPVRVEHRADIDAFEMTGLSDHFELVVYGSIVPMYELRPRTLGDGSEIIECVRKQYDS